MKKGIRALAAVMAVSFTMLAAGIVNAAEEKAFGAESFLASNPLMSQEVKDLLKAAESGLTNLQATQKSINELTEMYCTALATVVEKDKILATVASMHDKAQELMTFADAKYTAESGYMKVQAADAGVEKNKFTVDGLTTESMLTKAEAKTLKDLLATNEELTKDNPDNAKLTKEEGTFTKTTLAAKINANVKEITTLLSKIKGEQEEFTKLMGYKETSAAQEKFQKALQEKQVANYKLGVLSVLGQKINHTFGPCLLDDSVKAAQVAVNKTHPATATTTSKKDAVPNTAAQLYYFSPLVPQTMSLTVYVLPTAQEKKVEAKKMSYVGPLFTFDGLLTMQLVEMMVG